MSRTAHKLMASSGGDTGYEIEQSLRFDTGDTAHLKRTPSSAGNRRTFTLSAWIKTTDGFAADPIFCCGTGTNDASTTYIAFYQGKMQWQGYNTNYRVTNRVFRDTAAWYHFIWAVDTTQSTADNRIRLYVNGVEETSFGTKNNPSQNYEFIINSTNEHQLGDEGAQTGGYPPFDGHMAEVNFIDGAQLTPSSFGETDSITGQWIPKEIDGLTYGTNGFYLKFVSGAIGTDSSGQSNNYTATNLANSDVMLDSPTNNFPVLNFLDNGNNSTLSRGALKATFSGWSDTFGTFQVPFTGKWYWELAATTNGNLYYGLWTTNYTDTDAGQDYGTGKQVLGTGGITGGSSGAYFGSAVSNGDIIGMAVDCDNGKIWWSRNGTYGSSGNPATGANQALTFTATDVYKIIVAGASGNVSDINFGQNGTFTGTKTAQGNADGGGVGNFYYAPPSGFKALCTKNLPNPAVKKSSEHFNSVVYTGTGSTRSVTGVGHKPGKLWIKAYSTTDDHRIQDEVRGSTKQLDTNNTDAEYTAADGITSFDSDGFTIGADSSNQFNVSGTSSVAFSWKGAGSGSANTQGDIDSTVSVNNDAGFSIVTYTGNRTGAGVSTVGHGLSVAPKLVITKSRSNATNWWVQHPSTSSASHMLNLNGTAAETDKSSNGTLSRPTSTVFGTNWTDGIGTNSHTHVAYCFAEIEGFSQFGAYNGNAVVNGPFIHTGFTPKWIVWKHNGSGSEWWYNYDTARQPINPMTEMLFPNANSAEYVSGSNAIDIVSNGIKIRANNGGQNGYSNNSNATYFYMAFAESPVKYANAR